MKKIKGILSRVIVAVLVLGTAVHASPAWAEIAQSVDIASSPNPVGSGARAVGMGGAFIAVADDATAASWNPAGLIQLETPEMSVVGAYNYRSEDSTYEAFPEASGDQSVSTYDLNYLSAAYPFAVFDKNMIVSLNYQHLYDFKKEVRFSYRLVDTEAPALTLNNDVDYEQDGHFKPISPAFAVQITPSISFGLTMNFWDHGLSDNKWNSNNRLNGNGTFVDEPIDVTVRENEKYKMDGLKFEMASPSNWHNVNFNLGLMWNINSMFTLGAVFKSPFEAHLDRDYLFDARTTISGSPFRQTTSQSDRVILDMPMSYGAGLAARLSDALTLDLDVYRTNWSDFVLHTAEGTKLNPITGGLQNESDIDDTTQVRLGGEYLFIKETMIFPVRAGVFYDPEPADGSPDHFWGGTAGGGLAYKRFVYDIAYQYRFGRDVRTVTVGGKDSDQDVDQHTVYMSVIFHF